MKRRAGLWWAALALAVVAVAVPAGIGLASSGTQAAPARRAGPAPIHSAPSHRSPEPSRVKAVLADLMRTATAGRLTASTTAPGMPACAPPPIPTATYPPGRPYGVPFLAAITDGQVLAGYDQWTANHLAWTVGKRKFDSLPVGVEDLRYHRMGDGLAPTSESDGRDPPAGRRVLRQRRRQLPVRPLAGRPMHPDPGPVRPVAGQLRTPTGPRELSPRRRHLQQLLDADLRLLSLRGESGPLRNDHPLRQRGRTRRRARSLGEDGRGDHSQRGPATALDDHLHLHRPPPPPSRSRRRPPRCRPRHRDHRPPPTPTSGRSRAPRRL